MESDQPKTRAEIRSVVICDQIRREDNGKNLLIGVFGGDIIVTEFPVMLNLGLWLEHEFYGIGDLPLSFRLITDRGTELFNLNFVAELRQERTSGALSFNEIGAPLTDPCDLIVEFREHDGEWVRLKTKPVLRRPAVSRKAP